MSLRATEAGIPRTLVRLTGAQLRQRPERMATVSVIVPCYNYGRYLPVAVRSALNQEWVQTEVIIVDDASTDGSAAVARRLAAQDPRVRVIAHKRNAGPVASFNDGLAAADGEYLIRLDADDLLTPESAARAVALAEQYPTVGLVYGHPVHFASPSVPKRHRARATSWEVTSGWSWLELRCRLGVNCITSPEAVMRASVVAKVGGQRNLDQTHDMEMWLRLARESDVGWVGGCDQAWHREHADSRSAQQVDVMTDFRERAKAFETLFCDGRGDPAVDARLLELARSALANEALARASSAFAKGRGGTPETDGYLGFARSLGVDLETLPFSSVYRRAQQLGPQRARRSPYLIARAAWYRLGRELRRPQWRARGV